MLANPSLTCHVGRALALEDSRGSRRSRVALRPLQSRQPAGWDHGSLHPFPPACHSV